MKGFKNINVGRRKKKRKCECETKKEERECDCEMKKGELNRKIRKWDTKMLRGKSERET